MTEYTVKWMIWHKHKYRYHLEKLIHPVDGESWTHFDEIHDHQAGEAHNVRVALATNTFWPVFVIHVNLPPAYYFDDSTFFVIDNS